MCLFKILFAHIYQTKHMRQSDKRLLYVLLINMSKIKSPNGKSILLLGSFYLLFGCEWRTSTHENNNQYWHSLAR